MVPNTYLLEVQGVTGKNPTKDQWRIASLHRFYFELFHVKLLCIRASGTESIFFLGYVRCFCRLLVFLFGIDLNDKTG